MISSAHCDHAVLPRGVEFDQDFVKCSADLKCAGGLEDLQFEIDVRAQHFAERAAAHGGRALYVWTNALLGCADIHLRDHLEYP